MFPPVVPPACSNGLPLTRRSAFLSDPTRPGGEFSTTFHDETVMPPPLRLPFSEGDISCLCLVSLSAISPADASAIPVSRLWSACMVSPFYLPCRMSMVFLVVGYLPYAGGVLLFSVFTLLLPKEPTLDVLAAAVVAALSASVCIFRHLSSSTCRFFLLFTVHHLRFGHWRFCVMYPDNTAAVDCGGLPDVYAPLAARISP